MQRAVAGLLDALLATLVVVTATGSGAWLAIGLLDAGAQLMTAFTTSAAWHALAALAGLLALVDIVRAWRERARRGVGVAFQPRPEMPWIAFAAALAAIAIALSARPEAAAWQQLAAQRPAMHTNWWPAIGAALIAWCALLLSVPAPMRSRADLPAPRRAPTPVRLRARETFDRAAALIGRARAAARRAPGRVTMASSRRGPLPAPAAISSSRAARGWRALAPWPDPGVRLGPFLLLCVPVVYPLGPIALTMIEYGVTALVWLLAAAAMFPPLVLVPLLLAVLMGLAAACLAALPRLWWALLSARGTAPAWAAPFATIATLGCAAVAWTSRDAGFHWPLAANLRLCGHAVTPPAIAALDGALLLGVHALPRWPAWCEQLLRVLGGAATISVFLFHE